MVKTNANLRRPTEIFGQYMSLWNHVLTEVTLVRGTQHLTTVPMRAVIFKCLSQLCGQPSVPMVHWHIRTCLVIGCAGFHVGDITVLLHFPSGHIMSVWRFSVTQVVIIMDILNLMWGVGGLLSLGLLFGLSSAEPHVCIGIVWFVSVQICPVLTALEGVHHMAVLGFGCFVFGLNPFLLRFKDKQECVFCRSHMLVLCADNLC